MIIRGCQNSAYKPGRYSKDLPAHFYFGIVYVIDRFTALRRDVVSLRNVAYSVHVRDGRASHRSSRPGQSDRIHVGGGEATRESGELQYAGTPLVAMVPRGHYDLLDVGRGRSLVDRLQLNCF